MTVFFRKLFITRGYSFLPMAGSMRLIFLLPLFMVVSFATAIAQPDYFFKAYPRPEGLFRYKIRHLLQDQYGFIWLGTDDGLQRFDGQEYVTFRYDADDPHSLSANVITFLHLDKQQQLWIGTNFGLKRFDSAASVSAEPDASGAIFKNGGDLFLGLVRSSGRWG